MPKTLPIPLSQMTPEQRRQYNNAVAADYRERKRLGIVRPPRSQRVTSESVGSLIKLGAAPQTLGKKTIYLSLDLAQRVHNAVAALAGPPLYLDKTDFFDAATRNQLEALEAVYNEGKPFTPPPQKPWVRLKGSEKPKRGRPRKT